MNIKNPFYHHRAYISCVDRNALIQKIKLDPSHYVWERIARMDRDDIIHLLAALSKTHGIGDEARYIGKEIEE